MTRHTRLPIRFGLVVAVAALSLWGCASKPAPPDWQMDARSALERSVQAYLQGDARVESAEAARARAALSSTGRADLVARGELLRCAARIASLDLAVCQAFEPLAADASPEEQAYARYLQGQARAEDAPLLPAAQRPLLGAAAPAPVLQAITDPLAQLVGAGVLLQQGRADPAVIAQAIATASERGWRRPLLAWLGVQHQRALAAGDNEAAASIARRMALVAESLPL